MHDKNGTEIKVGNTLFNPYDRDQYHTVLQGEDGKLYLGDLDSPLGHYDPQTWWEVVHNAALSGDSGIHEKPVIIILEDKEVDLSWDEFVSATGWA